MPDGQIFKATYSGIPVYEMMSKGVAVMRRRSDSWLNATQILKVAGFDKPQRTRILEREVQKGEHEKVQGGYGKYQGTWIPLERGINLCQLYNCEHILRPILDFKADDKSPPLAPKHLASAPSLPKLAIRKDGPVAGSTISTRSSRRNVADVDDGSDGDTMSDRGSGDGSMTPSPSIASSSSHTPSPIRSSPEPSMPQLTLPVNHRLRSPSPTPANTRKRKLRNDEGNGAPLTNGKHETASYGDQILEYFISDTNQIPNVLITPPADFDPNMAIDDDGHTALHWASAMGRIRIVKLLLSTGADIFKVNKAGQTSLMRSVMFANNYDVRKFPELYELLHRSTLNIDNANRTIFHHIVDVAMSKGKTHAARYYMETVLGRLSDYPKELADIINFQDEDGETALTLAARCRSKRLVKLLLDHGADPKLRNKDGKTTEDYILEDERFRASPVVPSRTLSMESRLAQVANPPTVTTPNHSFSTSSAERTPLHYSTTGQKAATRVVNDITRLIDTLATAYDQELKDKERDLNQANALRTNIHTEILESQRTVSTLSANAASLSQVQQRLGELETELRQMMGKHYRLGWERWLREEEEREQGVRDVNGGELVVAAFEDNRYLSATGEDITDLVGLHEGIPKDEERIRNECKALRAELAEGKLKRAALFEELIKVQGDAGTGVRMSEYRRLIAAASGGLSPSDIDSVLSTLLETLESEESSSSTPWLPRPPPNNASS